MFDDICSRHKCYKVETIGDAYFVCSGLNFYQSEVDPSLAILSMAIEMQEAVKTLRIHGYPDVKITIRIGINAGPITAGIVGSDKIHYTLVGDTINTASRMESTCTPGKIQISEAVYQAAANFGTIVNVDVDVDVDVDGEDERENREQRTEKKLKLILPDVMANVGISRRGVLEVKGKGSMTTYFVNHTMNDGDFASKWRYSPNTSPAISPNYERSSRTLDARKRRATSEVEMKKYLPSEFVL